MSGQVVEHHKQDHKTHGPLASSACVYTAELLLWLRRQTSGHKTPFLRNKQLNFRLRLDPFDIVANGKLKIANIFEMTSRRAKRSEIWDSGGS